MCDELEERKQAMLMYHVQGCSKAEICQKMNRSRPWLNRWLKRYDPGNVDGSLQNRKAGPKQVNGQWTQETRKMILEMRRIRSKDPKWRYAYVGAKAIHYELKALGCLEVPPIRTIHSWFVAEDMIEHTDKPKEKRSSKSIPFSAVDRVNEVQQLDLKGPVYLKGSSTKYYLVVLRDRYSQRCAIDVFDSREAQNIVDFLVTNWKWMGLPNYLQMDNALEFRGSNRYPRSFGKVVRVAVDLKIEPLFNPPGEPWRNGGVEWFNSFLGDRLLKITFEDANALRTESWNCQDFCNQSHYLPKFDGLTPDQISASASLRFPPQDYKRHQNRKLPQDRGFVSFVRLVRKSGRITLGAGDRFMVDPDLAYEYVLARADLANKVVHISRGDAVLKTYDFSPDTVGHWAGEDQLVSEPVNDQIVKEQATM